VSEVAWQTPSLISMRERRLTPNEIQAWRNDITARLKVLEQRWKKSGGTDTQALLGALIFCEPQLPPWVFKGLRDRLIQQLPQEPPPYHGLRWLYVTGELARNPNMKVRAASEAASKQLAHTPARGAAGTVERSYYIFEKQQRAHRRKTPR